MLAAVLDDGHDVVAEISPLEFLRRDLLSAATTLTSEQARYLVDLYYQIQHNRTTANNQVKAAKKSAEPHLLIEWVHGQCYGLERSIVRILDAYSDMRADGVWAKSVFGIGPVLTAGLMAHIDVTKANTASGVWRFAGLDPTLHWFSKDEAAKSVTALLLGKTLQRGVVADSDVETLASTCGKRADTLRRDAMRFGTDMKITRVSLTKALSVCPYNQKLKLLAWKCADSFVKFSNHDECFYGHLWRQRKEQEERLNDSGALAEQAALQLTKKNYRGDTKAKACYEEGKLPPGHVHARSMRWVAKLFLSHYFDIAYETHFGTAPPKPYVFAIAGHKDFIDIPGWPLEASAADRAQARSEAKGRD